MRKRDVVKAIRRNGHFVILAVELQGMAHYFMPLRCTEYDLYDLLRQREDQAKRYLKNGEAKRAEEYLSGGTPEDKLRPVVTFVLHLGSEWNAARSLHDLYDLEAVDEEMMPLLLDHEIKVVNLTDLDENCFETELRELIALVKCKDDKAAMLAYYEEHRDRFREMDADAFDLICAMLNLDELLLKAGKEKTKRENDGGKVNMCKAFDEILKDREKIGEERGEKRGREIGEKSGEERVTRLIGQLFKDDRMEDILRVTQSLAARQALYREYGLQ